MAINPYFHNHLGEQNLVEDVTIEIIKGVGQDCYYIPREYFNIDKIFGEDPGSSFTDSYILEMYIQSFRGFDGTDIVTQFGIEIKDKITLVFSRKRFKEEVTDNDNSIIRPREGDLIYLPLSKSLFEINFVEHENPLYPLGKLYSYTIIAELFTYSYEKVSTHVTEIDKVVENTHQENYENMFMLSNGSGNFHINNSVYLYDTEFVPGILIGGASAAAWDSANSILTISGISGSFATAGLVSYRIDNGSCAGISYTGIQNYIIPINNGIGTTAGNANEIDEEAILFNVDKNTP